MPEPSTSGATPAPSAPQGAEAYASDMPVTGTAAKVTPESLAIAGWQAMTEDEKLAVKQSLYFAGFYGDKLPQMWGQVDEADVAAFAQAQQLADINQTPWQELVDARAQMGAEQGSPYTHLNNPDAQSIYDQSITQLRDFALNNGIELPESYIATTAKDIENGVQNFDSVVANLRDTYVAQAYPAYAEQIKAGQDLSTIAMPYLTAMASTLELPPGSLSVNDRTIQRALQAKDRDGKPATVPLWQFQDALKKDSRYQYTTGAHEEMASSIDSLLSQAGLG